VLDQRGVADRFLSQGQAAQIAGFSMIHLDISDFPTRHNYGLALRQEPIERTLAAWVDELKVPSYRGREVTGFAQDDTGVDVELGGGRSLRARYLVGCDGGRSLIRKKAGIDFPGWDPSISYLIAEVQMAQEPAWRAMHGDSRAESGAKDLKVLARCTGGGRLPPPWRRQVRALRRGRARRTRILSPTLN
jgi:2-polyprenyl-6-methoxyphenol hydroxylase-like FAD-dependent oxidoreductase